GLPIPNHRRASYPPVMDRSSAIPNAATRGSQQTGCYIPGICAISGEVPAKAENPTPSQHSLPTWAPAVLAWRRCRTLVRCQLLPAPPVDKDSDTSTIPALDIREQPKA